jgi:hypothetical protein
MGDPSPLILMYNTWMIWKCMGKGAFRSIHFGLNVHTKELVAVKIEDLQYIELLIGEACIVKSVRGEPGFPYYDCSGFENNNSTNTA